MTARISVPKPVVTSLHNRNKDADRLLAGPHFLSLIPAKQCSRCCGPQRQRTGSPPEIRSGKSPRSSIQSPRWSISIGTTRGNGWLCVKTERNETQSVHRIHRLLGWQLAAAQDTTKVWTLRECLDHALENNIGRRQSRNEMLSGVEDTKEARTALFPSLTASASQGYTNYPSSQAHRPQQLHGYLRHRGRHAHARTPVAACRAFLRR